jgi:hypothetical protein
MGFCSLRGIITNNGCGTAGYGFINVVMAICVRCLKSNKTGRNRGMNTTRIKGKSLEILGGITVKGSTGRQRYVNRFQ